MEISREMTVKAEAARVWRAISDYREFGEWFGVRLEGPFSAGAKARGKMTYPGYEHFTMEMQIETIEPERHFSFRWHPYAVNPQVDYSGEATTLITFELTPTPEGTRVQVTESGFEAIPEARRAEAYRKNSGGWEQQLKNIAAFVNR